MAEMRRRIEVVPYDPAWKVEFEKLRELLVSCIGDLLIGVEHVGSTSVEGLAAKPILDVDAVMQSYDVFPEIVARLGKQGFLHRGDLGIAGREAFSRPFDDGFMKYHLYVCPKDGKELLRHLAFRNYLRGHADARDEYASLKQANAEKFRYDIDGYIEAKSWFINGILEKTTRGDGPEPV